MALRHAHDIVMRFLTLWIMILPLLFKWYSLQFLAIISRWDGEKYQIQQQRFHECTAPIACQIIAKLGGYYIKVGQRFCLSRGIIPDVYIRACKPLFDQVPSRPFNTIAEVFLRSTKLRIDQAFKEIDTEPLGAASLSQAHRARLRAEFGGKDVVLKVQYPEVGYIFLLDLSNILFLARLFAPEIYCIFKIEYEAHVAELDFRNEARNLVHVGSAMTRAGFSPSNVVIPQPYEQFTSHKTLVMDFLPGKSYQAHVYEHLTSFAQALGFRDVEELHARYEDECVGGQFLTKKKEKYIASFARFKVNIEHYIASFSHHALLQPHRKLRTSDLQHILDLVIQVHGHQLLIDGYANIDPHPGNIIVMPDGRIGLIDYGQCAVFSSKERCTIAQILLGLRTCDKVTVAKLMCDCGFACTNNCVAFAYRTAELFFNRFTDEPIEYDDGSVIPGTAKNIRARHSLTGSSRLLVTANRITAIMLGLSLMIGSNTSLAKSWERMAIRVITEAANVETSRATELSPATKGNHWVCCA